MDNLITVVIPTYNRGYIIERALSSLENQTCKKFEVIVVDDGSTDKTKQIIQNYIKNSHMNIRYYYKENGGVHTARNFALAKIETEFFYGLDSDDMCKPDAIENMYKILESFSDIEKETYRCGIIGLCERMSDSKIIGGEYPKNINKMSLRRYLSYYYRGERTTLRNTRIFKEEFPFLEFPGVKHVPEGTRNEEFFSKYRYYATNCVFRIYDTKSQDAITNSKNFTLEKCLSMRLCNLYKINHASFSLNFPISRRLRSFIYYVRFSLNLGLPVKEIICDINRTSNRVICILLFPLGLIHFTVGKKPQQK